MPESFLRLSTWLAIACLLFICSTATLGQQQPVTLEQHLNALAEEGFPGPVVATLELPPSEKAGQSAEGDTSSLAGVAEKFGLKLFKQDGIYVIGPAQRYDFNDLFSGAIQPERPAGEWCAELLHSLSASQFRALGSPRGLPFRGLTSDQQAILAAIFAPGYMVAYAPPDSKPDLSTAIPAERMPLEAVVLSASLEVHHVNVGVRHPNARGVTRVRMLASISTGGRQTGGWMMFREAESRRRREIPLGTLIANTLKESNLDYSRRALRVPVSVSGKTNVRDLIALVAQETRLTLHASPGSEHVPIFVSASNVPAGRLLKAVSLATTGTWRRFGDAYLFAADLAGIGQIAARLRELRGSGEADEVRLATAAYRLVRDMNPFSVLSFAPDSGFVLYPEQISFMLSASISPQSSQTWIPWNSLGPEQQAFVQQEVAERQDAGDDRDFGADPASWLITPRVGIKFAFQFPTTGPVFVSDVPGLTVLPPRDSAQVINLLSHDAPATLRLPLNEPLRGYVCKPSKREKPASLISAVEGHGFNTLYLRVFTDGYTAFPSKQFPRMAGLGDAYLEELISLAHSKGIKVFGVVDVLRWSDGRRRHWLSKKSDLLDYDIFGRTHAQWANSRIVPDLQLAIEQIVPGEAFSGDVVTPLSPEVAVKLQELLEELASFSLDGLVFDYVTVLHPEGGPDLTGDHTSGQPGHNGTARQEFFAKYGADSVDIPDRGDAWYPKELPLRPIVSAYSQLHAHWEALYNERCERLLDGLIKKWGELKKDSPIWVMDTRGFSGPSRDWSKYKGRIEGLFLIGIEFETRGLGGQGLKVMPALGTSERMGTLLFATLLASGQGQKFEGMIADLSLDKPWEAEGVVIDFTCAGRKKKAYLRLIAPPDAKSR